MKDGIYSGENDLSIEAYHENKTHTSSSALRLMRKSPKHFNEYYKKEQVRKSHFDFGNAFEIALLFPDDFAKRVKIVDTQAKIMQILEARPELKSPKASKDYKEWKADAYNDDRYIIDATGPESFETIEHMLASCYEDATIQKLIKNSDYQFSAFWTDKETGMKLKTRPDSCHTQVNICTDVKTALDASPEAFSKAAAQHDYAIQAVMQIDGIIQSGRMSQVDTYYWLTVEKVAPYCAVLYKFKREDREWVDDLYRHWLRLLAEAKKTNKYPGYQQRSESAHGVIDLEFPMWYKALSQNF